MQKQIDICSTCRFGIRNYTSVIGTVPWCCEKHWHCKPGSLASDYVPKPKLDAKKGDARVADVNSVIEHLQKFKDIAFVRWNEAYRDEVRVVVNGIVGRIKDCSAEYRRCVCQNCQHEWLEDRDASDYPNYCPACGEPLGKED